MQRVAEKRVNMSCANIIAEMDMKLPIRGMFDFLILLLLHDLHRGPVAPQQSLVVVVFFLALFIPNEDRF